MPRPFFFSYAHNDALDDRLDEFFAEVSLRVRGLTGHREDGFRDSVDLQPQKLVFDPAVGGLVPRLEEVRNKNNLLVLLIDGAALANPALAACLREVDERRMDACSALVVWPAGARTSAADQLVQHTFQNLRLKQAPFFFPAIERPQQFVEAVRESVDTLRNVIIRDPRGVTSLTPTSPFAAVPSISGPGSQRAA